MKGMEALEMLRFSLLVGVFLFLGTAVFAQGTISGVVTDSSGASLPGVTVEATSDGLPQSRVTVTNANGRYRLPALPVGNYTMVFTMTGFNTVKFNNVFVRLEQTTPVNVAMNPDLTEEMVVSAETPLLDPTSTELSFALGDERFEKVPLGEDYRDLLRLAPGVQVTEFNVRGPSAGGNGQDNIYKFDGVDVTLPLFGTLAADPSNHDIDQVSIVRGGAQALNFNRSGGLLINSVSRSGTNKFQGELNLLLQDEGFVGDPDRPPTSLEGDTSQQWLSANVGGPLIQDRLFFYGSYYSPSTDLENRSNVYGDHPDGERTRDEFFGKLTFSPTQDITIHGSFRNTEVDTEAEAIGALDAQGLTRTEFSDQQLTVLEADWILGGAGSLHFKFTDMQLDTGATPNGTISATPSTQLGSTIDLANLDALGIVSVPTLSGAAYQPFVDRYGFLNESGVRTGGGRVGINPTFDSNDFGRTAFQIAWNYFVAVGDWQHDIHIGYRHTEDEEDLARDQQGFGRITFLADTPDTEAVEFLQAEFIRSTGSEPIHSEYHSDNLEINDTITKDRWTFNVGVLLSRDELYGQDLAEDPSTPSGFRVEVGNIYRMYEIDWSDMIQPRLGAIYELRNNETVYVNYAVYNPMASSLPRAASWARNRRNLITRNVYDVNGVLVDSFPRGSTSGKFFQEDMDPRQIAEYLVGYDRQMDNGWAMKFSGRYRRGSRFWEDTNNNARITNSITAPEELRQQLLDLGLYIPDLDLFRFGDEGQNNGIGGSSFVIAQLDGAFTKYYELTADVEKRGQDYYLKGTYTWSHYYGNFDQDNASSNNDINVFIGSSFIADGVGRQLWDFKYGDLKGDRRHIFKLFGSKDLSWNASVGAFFIYQSGEPWEASDVNFYREFTGSSSSTNRFAEPAGSRRGDDHFQLDLNYSQSWDLSSVRLQAILEIFNVLDEQTDFNIESNANSPNFGIGRDFYEPQRFRLGAKVSF